MKTRMNLVTAIGTLETQQQRRRKVVEERVVTERAPGPGGKSDAAGGLALWEVSNISARGRNRDLWSGSAH